MVQTNRRRWRSISVEGAVPATPPAAAAFEVPTAGVPTYFVASTVGLAGFLAASGFGLTLPISNSAMSSPPCLSDLGPNLNRRPSRTAAPPTASRNCEQELVNGPAASGHLAQSARGHE